MTRRVIVVVLGALIIGAGLVWLRFERDMGQLRERVAAGSTLADLPTGKLEFADVGTGSPVLVIHGSGGGFDQGLEMTDPLSDAGYRRIAPSRFGYLRSEVPSGASPALQADAFAALLDSLGIERAFVFGGSAGALSATEFAIRYPDRCRALVLLVPASYSPDRKPNESAFEGPIGEGAVRAVLGSDFLFWLAIALAPDALTRTVLATEPAVVQAQPEGEQSRIRAMLRHILPVSARAEGLLLDSATAGTPPPARLSGIRCPVLAVSARDDLYGTAAAAEYAASNVRNGRAVIYETGGHLLAGHNDEAWREIAAFYAETGNAPPAAETSPSG